MISIALFNPAGSVANLPDHRDPHTSHTRRQRSKGLLTLAATVRKRKETELAWKISAEQIKAAGFNLDIKNPHNADTGPGDVDELLKEYEELLASIAGTKDELRSELEAALEESA